MRAILPALATLALLGCPGDKPQDAPLKKDPEQAPATKTTPEKKADTKKAPEKADAKAFRGANFETIVPEGFAERTIPGTPKGTLSMYRTKRQPTPESFLSSIVFVPIVYPNQAARQLIQDPKLCRATGEQMIAMIQKSQPDKLTLTRASIAELPAGKACQTEIAASSHENPHDAIGTVMQSESGDVSVTCNIARGDDAGRAACMEVLGKWVWKTP